MRIQATREWKSHRITRNSAVLGEIKVTASVVHPSHPLQLKGNSCPRLQVGGGLPGGGSVCVCGGGVVVYQVFVFSDLLAPPPAHLVTSNPPNVYFSASTKRL